MKNDKNVNVNHRNGKHTHPKVTTSPYRQIVSTNAIFLKCSFAQPCTHAHTYTRRTCFSLHRWVRLYYGRIDLNLQKVFLMERRKLVVLSLISSLPAVATSDNSEPLLYLPGVYASKNIWISTLSFPYITFSSQHFYL